MKKFGKFTARRGRFTKMEDPRFTYYDNEAGIEWDEFFSRPENQSLWYLAVDDGNRICCAEQESIQVRCGGLRIAGLDSIEPYTNGEGGTIYGCRLDWASGKILPPPPPAVSAVQLRLALYEAGFVERAVEKIFASGRRRDDLRLIRWRYSPRFERSSDLINWLENALPAGAQSMDKIWGRALEIEE